VANTWRKGLESWEIAGERIAQFKSAVDFAIFTPAPAPEFR
jgi:hypothetical protein